MKIKRLALYLISTFLLLLILVFFVLRGSLPILSGTRVVKGLSHNVSIDRDKHSIPTIKAENRNDASFALGFLHAQERFFQMDLMRRMAAGELSELFGRVAIETDKKKRLHRLKAQSEKTWSLLSSHEQTLLHSYTEGVNSGLDAMQTKPFEYYVLGAKLLPWKKEDSILVGMSLFFELQDSVGALDWTRGILKAYLPLEIYIFFTQNRSIWDAPLGAEPQLPQQIPPKKCFEYLQEPLSKEITSCNIKNLPRSKGSNQWAVGPNSTEEKIPFLACDMHLNLSVPNIWYRASLHYKNANKDIVRVHGISLPGTPLIAAGSNEHIAWGFTNAYINTTDLVILENDSSKSFDYLTSEGPKLFEEIYEQINVKGANPIDYKINWSQWGPIHPERFLGQNIAIKWIAHDPGCFNFLLINLETSSRVSDVLQSHGIIRLPALNLMLADKKGHIGWSYLGSIPKRLNQVPEVPVSSLEKNATWTCCWEQTDFPQIIDPPKNCLWTANNRVLLDPLLGNDYLNSIRAYQIKKRLFASDQHTMNTMHAIQLDDKAYFFERWFDLLKSSLNIENARHAQLLSILKKWDHHCKAESEGYFWIRKFRDCVINRTLTHFLAPCLAAYPNLQLELLDFEEPVFLIVSEQPEYLNPPTCNSWNLELSDIIDQVLRENASQLKGNQKWGNWNISQIKHPLGNSLMFFNSIINMKEQPLSGDYYVPRLASPTEGASMRFLVSPGAEQNGILNMPCGQSGHPLSQFYRDQYKLWLQGKAMNLLPGETQYNLKLIKYSKECS